MTKKIAMFVWNYFTNDARVMRECSALQEAGYQIDLIAIHDPKDAQLAHKEILAENFTVYRVKSTCPQLFVPLVKGGKYLKEHPLSLLVLGILLLPAVLMYPVQAILLLIFSALLYFGKVQVLFRRSFIFIRMVRLGLSGDYWLYHANDLNTLPQGILCAKVFRRRKLLYDSHEVQTSRTGYNSPLYGISEKIFLRFVDSCIHENHTRAAYIEEKYGFYPEVIHNYPIPATPEMSRKICLNQYLDISEEEPILLYQGGIQTGRGLEKLIAAVPLFERGVVVLIGDGRMKTELEQQVLEAGLTERIRFLPKVPLAELLHYTRNAYLGFQLLNNVCFNHYSASSNKLFEYMMSGVPVIGSDFPEIRQVITQEKIGLVVDSHEPIAIAAGVNQLLASPALREKMHQNCLKARRTYNWNEEKKRFLEIYAEIEDGYGK
ncbi:glycosyltransferase family 4 protein [Listeria costaricensis]|uniref:glycosyltransferase family 4 protein n=1 Tax=Listeria costaricensis TaxID=2026604 RepID=UPI001F09AA02|nr:glycosyltransferase family 4 protein [Listeria costaricensis]